jgi:hypothetical protein
MSQWGPINILIPNQIAISSFLIALTWSRSSPINNLYYFNCFLFLMTGYFPWLFFLRHPQFKTKSCCGILDIRLLLNCFINRHIDVLRQNLNKIKCAIKKLQLFMEGAFCIRVTRLTMISTIDHVTFKTWPTVTGNSVLVIVISNNTMFPPRITDNPKM